jgi:acyl carrier protein
MAQDFTRLFAEAIDMSPDVVTRDAAIRELEMWDSVAALGVLAMVEEHYGVALTGDDFANVKTVGDLETLVAGRAKR